MRWEYHVETSGDMSTERLESHLTKRGAKGWELVSVVRIVNASKQPPEAQYIFFFKRPLPE